MCKNNNRGKFLNQETAGPEPRDTIRRWYILMLHLMKSLTLDSVSLHRDGKRETEWKIIQIWSILIALCIIKALFNARQQADKPSYTVLPIIILGVGVFEYFFSRNNINLTFNDLVYVSKRKSGEEIIQNSFSIMKVK